MPVTAEAEAKMKNHPIARQEQQGKIRRFLKLIKSVYKIEPVNMVATPKALGWVSTGYQELDDTLSGKRSKKDRTRIIPGSGRGFPRGRIVEIFGPEAAAKCLVAGTYVSTECGWQTIQEVFQSQGLDASCVGRTTEAVIALTNRHGRLERTTACTHNGKRPVTRIVTRSGVSVESTANHPHLVMNERGQWVWVLTKDIRVGDYVVTTRRSSAGLVSCPAEEMYIVGALIADASFGHNRIAFTNDDDDIKSEILCHGPTLLGVGPRRYPNKDSPNSEMFCFNSKKGVSTFYSRFGLAPGRAASKSFSSVLRQLQVEPLRALIQGFMDCECAIMPKKSAIEVSSASETLLRQLKLLLTVFGVVSFLRKIAVKEYPTTDYWKLSITGAEARRYADVIGTRSRLRLAKLVGLQPSRHTNVDVIPHCEFLIRDLADANETTREHDALIGDYVGGRKRVSGLTYDRLARIVGLPWRSCLLLSRLEEILRAGYFYDRVKAVEPVGSRPTFDFVLPETNSFLANGVVTHNTALALTVIASAQKKGLACVFIDVEHALDEDFARNDLGVDMDAMPLLEPDDGDDALKLLIEAVKLGVDVVVLDSVSALSPKAEKAGKEGLGAQARMMSKVCRELTSYLAKGDGPLVIFINQIRYRIGVIFGSPEMTSGGNALKFYSSVRVEVRKRKDLKKASAKKGEPAIIGHRIRMRVVKNKVAPAYNSTLFDIKYGEGIRIPKNVKDHAEAGGEE